MCGNMNYNEEHQQPSFCFKVPVIQPQSRPLVNFGCENVFNCGFVV